MAVSGYLHGGVSRRDSASRQSGLLLAPWDMCPSHASNLIDHSRWNIVAGAVYQGAT